MTTYSSIAVPGDAPSATEDRHDLVAATADGRGVTVYAPQKGFAALWEGMCEAGNLMEKNVLQRATAADRAIRKYPYQAAAAALGIGALIAWLIVPRDRVDPHTLPQ